MTDTIDIYLGAALCVGVAFLDVVLMMRLLRRRRQRGGYRRADALVRRAVPRRGRRRPPPRYHEPPRYRDRAPRYADPEPPDFGDLRAEPPRPSAGAARAQRIAAGAPPPRRAPSAPQAPRYPACAGVTVFPNDELGPVEEGGPAELLDSEATSVSDLVLLSGCARSDKGLMRVANEDAILIDSGKLFAVADGMGGHSRGEIASRRALEAFARGVKQRGIGGPIPGLPRRAAQIVHAIRAANATLRQEAASPDDPIGTTLVAARFVPSKGQVYIANVGDSRCYRVRRGNARLITTDHAEAADGGRKRGRLVRALGMQEDVKVDVFMDHTQVGDFYLLCSDGLWAGVSEERIAQLVVSGQQLDEVVRKLIAEAIYWGARDDVSAVLVRVDEMT